jgi:cytochrome c biogenesis protein CcdA
VVPAVYMTTAPRAVRQVLEFSLGVFTAYLVCGVLLLLGPAKLLLDLLPHPEQHAKHLLELGGGAVLIAVAAGVWLARRRLAALPAPGSSGRKGSGFVIGVTLMLAEFPTAFPYFGAVALAAGSGASLPVQVLMLVVFNLLFVAPLVAIALVIALVPGVRERVLQPAAGWLTRHWPKVFAGLVLAIGLGLAVGGAVGLAREQ